MIPPVERDLPAGTVTFLFTDIEGSTRLLQKLGTVEYAKALMEHRKVLRQAFIGHGGVEVSTEGDSFLVAFSTASGALEAAAEGQEALAGGSISVRMGLHTGTAHVVEDDYVGEDVHLGARIAAAGHGGQVLVSQQTRQLVEVELTDLGEHRLKDFEGPVAIFQLGSERHPPLKTISNSNLPRPASSFLGREREIGELISLLREGARALTLTGPGGSGKTRLAIEAASELVPEFKAGVFWVDLAALRDPTLVTDTVAQTLGAKDGLAEHVGDRELLLVLDNLEQVIAAAPELAALVEACPNLQLLVTSRELLRIRGEIEYPVFPLAEADAVELFCVRAGVEPDEHVHRLCQALDNLPLALELAAARARVLSSRQILERLSGRLDLLKGGRDVDPRQQTLRATIEWSYDLLAAEEQLVFARLAVFRGGCTLEAIEAVALADLDSIQSLVDKSLLRRTDQRFWMLETIGQYAAEKLVESGESEQVRRNHASLFAHVAEEVGEGVVGGSQLESLDQLETEHDNIRAALAWSLEREPLLGARMAAALGQFWFIRGHLTEGRKWLGQALSVDTDPALEARLHIALSKLAWEQFDLDEAGDSSQRAWSLAESLDDTTLLGRALAMRGRDLVDQQDYQTASQVLHRATAHLEDSQESTWLADCRRWLGHIARYESRLDDAVTNHRQAKELFLAAGDLDGAAAATGAEGRDLYLMGDIEAAVATIRDAIEMHRRVEGRVGVASGRVLLAQMLAFHPDLDDNALEEAMSLYREGLPVLLEVGDTGAHTEVLDGTVLLLVELGDEDLAARVWGAILTGREDLQVPEILRANDPRIEAVLEQALGPEYGSFVESGRGLSVTEAARLALERLEAAEPASGDSG